MSGGDGVYNPTDTTDIEDQLDDIEAALVVIDDEIEDIQADVTDILAVTNALPTLAETGGTVTTDGTEQDVYINAVPLGVFNPICVKIDCTNQTAGETIVIRQYSQTNPALVPDLILEDEVTYAGLISPEQIIIDLDPNRFGVAVTMERTGGVARAYRWQVFYEI